MRCLFIYTYYINVYINQKQNIDNNFNWNIIKIYNKYKITFKINYTITDILEIARIYLYINY